MQFVSWICSLWLALCPVFDFFHVILAFFPCRFLPLAPADSGQLRPDLYALPQDPERRCLGWRSGRASAGQHAALVGRLGLYLSILKLCSVAWAKDPSPLSGEVRVGVVITTRVFSCFFFLQILAFFFFFPFFCF